MLFDILCLIVALIISDIMEHDTSTNTGDLVRIRNPLLGYALFPISYLLRTREFGMGMIVVRLLMISSFVVEHLVLNEIVRLWFVVVCFISAIVVIIVRLIIRLKRK